jgi:hypothetical protein
VCLVGLNEYVATPAEILAIYGPAAVVSHGRYIVSSNFDLSKTTTHVKCLTADLLDYLDTLWYGHIASFPSTQNPVDVFAATRPIAVTFVALKVKTLADVIKRLGYFGVNLKFEKKK